MEKLEEEISPGIHDKVAGRARELHISHDHEAGRHHVDADGEQTDHPTAEEAHAHAARAAGLYPAGNEGGAMAKPGPDGEDYAVQPL